jgi:hypothetical protein
MAFVWRQGAQQVPSLGMTRGRTVIFIRSRQIGWTESNSRSTPLRTGRDDKGEGGDFYRSRQIGWTESNRRSLRSGFTARRGRRDDKFV